MIAQLLYHLLYHKFTVIGSSEFGSKQIQVSSEFDYKHTDHSKTKTWHTHMVVAIELPFDILRPEHNGKHFEDSIFKCIFFHQNHCISIKIWRTFVLRVKLTINQYLFG